MEKNITIYRISKSIDMIYNIDINISKKSTIYIYMARKVDKTREWTYPSRKANKIRKRE